MAHVFLSVLRDKLTRFARREDGNVAIEFVIVAPIMFWGFLSMFAIFDAYRQYAINQKAAYTIGDLVSRQTNAIDPSFMTGTRDLFDYMTRSSEDSAMRVTSVKYDAGENKYLRDWSRTVGWIDPATETEVNGWSGRLPVMPDQEHITVVETWSEYTPPFKTGLTEKTIINFVFTRPRYAPRITWKN